MSFKQYASFGPLSGAAAIAAPEPAIPTIANVEKTAADMAAIL
jgi:hypothetical protein